MIFIQVRPGRRTTANRRQRCFAQVGSVGALGNLERPLAPLGSSCKRFLADNGSANCAQVGLKFGRCRSDRCLGRGILGDDGYQLRQLGQREAFYVRVKALTGHRRWSWASAPGVVGRAGVVVSALLRRSPRHYVAAASAAHQTRKQRSRPAGTRRAGDVDLCSLKVCDRDQRVMGRWIDVATVSELAQVDTVSQHMTNPAWGHVQPPSDHRDRHLSRTVPEGGADFIGLVVGDQAPRLGVALIPTRCLSLPPDAPLNRGRSTACELLGVDLALVFGDRQEQVSVKAPASGCRVDALPDDDHLPAGRLDAIPAAQLLADVAPKPRQVADDNAAVVTAFDPFDTGEQGWAIFEGKAARHVELRREHFKTYAVSGGVALKIGDLIFGRMESLAFSSAQRTDANEAGEREVGHRREYNTPYGVPSTLNRRSPVEGQVSVARANAACDVIR